MLARWPCGLRAAGAYRHSPTHDRSRFQERPHPSHHCMLQFGALQQLFGRWSKGRRVLRGHRPSRCGADAAAIWRLAAGLGNHPRRCDPSASGVGVLGGAGQGRAALRQCNRGDPGAAAQRGCGDASAGPPHRSRPAQRHRAGAPPPPAAAAAGCAQGRHRGPGDSNGARREGTQRSRQRARRAGAAVQVGLPGSDKPHTQATPMCGCPSPVRGAAGLLRAGLRVSSRAAGPSPGMVLAGQYR
jgi:hypothetical protein